MIGYSLTGLREQHIMVLMNGVQGRNGKDTIMELFTEIFKPFCDQISGSVLLQSGKEDGKAGPNPEVMDLRGKRIGYIPETNKTTKLNMGDVKRVTGCKFLGGRHCHGRFMTFRNQLTPFLETNYLPSADATDDTMFTRPIIITFTQRFLDPNNPADEYNPKNPNHHVVDRKMPEKLMAEVDGIIAWVVQGAMDYFQNGLNIPEEIRAENLKYRESEDIFGQFLEETCEIGNDFKAQSSFIYKAYREWMEGHGYKRILTDKLFKQEMERRHYTSKKTSGVIKYTGLQLKSPSYFISVVEEEKALQKLIITLKWAEL